MNDLTENINTVNNPQQAIEEFVGEQFIEWLRGFILSEMRAWPVIQKLGAIQTSQAKIKKFMLQRFLASRALMGTKEGEPGFLRFAIANLSESDDPEAENALEILETRLNQESQSPNLEFWMSLLHQLGATDEELAHTEPKETTRNYIADLSELFSDQDWQTAIGGFASFEWAEAEEYLVISKMLKNNADSQKSLGFNPKSAFHANHLLEKVVFDPQTKTLVWEGVVRQMQIHQDFLTGLTKYLDN